MDNCCNTLGRGTINSRITLNNHNKLAVEPWDNTNSVGMGLKTQCHDGCGLGILEQ